MSRFREQFGGGQVKLWVETRVSLAQQPSRCVRTAWVFHSDQDAIAVQQMLLQGCTELFKDPRLVAGSRCCSACRSRKPCSEFARRQVGRAQPTCKLCTLSEEHTKQETRSARLESRRLLASKVPLPKPRPSSARQAELAKKWQQIKLGARWHCDSTWRKIHVVTYVVNEVHALCTAPEIYRDRCSGCGECVLCIFDHGRRRKRIVPPKPPPPPPRRPIKSTVFDPVPVAVLVHWEWLRPLWQWILSRYLLRLRELRLCKLLRFSFCAFKWRWNDYSDEDNDRPD
jgi:hypothetical protein